MLGANYIAPRTVIMVKVIQTEIKEVENYKLLQIYERKVLVVI